MSYFDFSETIKRAPRTISTMRVDDAASLIPPIPVPVNGVKAQIMDYQMIGNHLAIQNVYDNGQMVIQRANGGNPSAWATNNLFDEFQIQGGQDYFLTDFVLETTWAVGATGMTVLPQQLMLDQTETYLNNSTLIHTVRGS